jgi:hypothetical protein
MYRVDRTDHVIGWVATVMTAAALASIVHTLFTY